MKTPKYQRKQGKRNPPPAQRKLRQTKTNQDKPRRRKKINKNSETKKKKKNSNTVFKNGCDNVFVIKLDGVGPVDNRPSTD